MGVVVLTLLARLRYLGQGGGRASSMCVLGMYVALVGYELFLLRNIPLD